MLAIETPHHRFACAAWGVWPLPVSVSLDDVLAIPPRGLRGRIDVKHAGEVALVKGHAVRIRGVADAPDAVR